MKKKRTYTRRQRAIRWLGALLAALMLGHCTGTYHVLPSHTIAPIRQEQMLGDMDIIHSEWGADSPMLIKRLYLSKNERFLLLSAAAFHPMLGWYYFGPGIVIDYDDPKSYHATWTATKDEQVWVCLVGCVPEGETAPTYSMGPTKDGTVWFDDDLGYSAFEGEPLTVTPVADIPVEGGMCYLETYSLSRSSEAQPIMVALNEDGQLSLPENRIGTSASAK